MRYENALRCLRCLLCVALLLRWIMKRKKKAEWEDDTLFMYEELLLQRKGPFPFNPYSVAAFVFEGGEERCNQVQSDRPK